MRVELIVAILLFVFIRFVVGSEPERVLINTIGLKRDGAAIRAIIINAAACANATWTTGFRGAVSTIGEGINFVVVTIMLNPDI